MFLRIFSLMFAVNLCYCRLSSSTVGGAVVFAPSFICICVVYQRVCLVVLTGLNQLSL